MDRGAWRATGYGVTKSWTWLKWLSIHTIIKNLICLIIHRINLTWRWQREPTATPRTTTNHVSAHFPSRSALGWGWSVKSSGGFGWRSGRNCCPGAGRWVAVHRRVSGIGGAHLQRAILRQLGWKLCTRQGGRHVFSGCPVVKNIPPNAGDTGLIPGWGLRSHMPQSN